MSKLQYTFSRPKDDVLVVEVEGWLDASNAREFSDAQEREMADAGIRDIVWDAAGLTLIASAGLRVLMAAYKMTLARKGTTYLVRANKNVGDIVRTIKLDQFIQMRDGMDGLWTDSQK